VTAVTARPFRGGAAWSRKGVPPVAGEAAGAAGPDREEVLEALRAVVDPEIGLNVVDLGLVYGLDVDEAGCVRVEMTLTTPGCPLHAAIHEAVERVLRRVPGVRSVDLELVWVPPWTPDMITPAGRRALGWPEEA
jgi:metal-sulfur cluster biosynthetic enzyme